MTYGHGSLNRGPDPWTAIPHATDTSVEQRRKARAYMSSAVGRGLITADELATYTEMLFTPEELTEMDT